jgi:hypothetical protein
MLRVALTLLLQDAPAFDPAVHEATRGFAYDDFLLVPVRVHLLRSKTKPELDCRLKQDDVLRLFSKANRIWNKAGVALDLESVVEEEADAADFDAAKGAEAWKAARPAGSRAPGMLHVYYVHLLPMNGIYMGADAIVVKDTAALRTVKGGVDEPIPRVTSHEIGHAFGLGHRQDTINLMASGTTGWSLNDAEIAAARGWAAKRDWILAPEAALRKMRFDALTAIPGESNIKEAARAALKK